MTVLTVYQKIITMKKFLTILVLTAVCGAANAIDNPKSPVGMAVVKSGSVFKLFYKGVKRSDVKVTIYNDKGEAVYKETLHKLESFVRPYNFSSIGEGDYTLELEGDDGKQSQAISYHNGSAPQTLMKLIKVSDANDKYVLSVANQGSAKIQVRIFDNANGLVYDKSEKLSGNFAQVYNLADLGSDFSFEVTDQQGITQTLVYNKK